MDLSMRKTMKAILKFNLMDNWSIPTCFYRVSVKALIIDDEWRFLLSKEKNWVWDLPGGWLDEWESISDGLKREIKEEMWLDVNNHESQPSYFFKFTGKNGKEKINVLYLTSVKNFIFTPSDECMEIRFFHPEDIENIAVFPNILEFLKHYNPDNHANI